MSSFGYHYWDPAVTPKNNKDIHWPPLPKKPYPNYNCHVDFNKQSNRVNIEDMTPNMHELRFEMVEKSPEKLSTYTSPRSFSITSKLKRICKINKKKGKDFYLTDKTYSTEHYYAPDQLRKGYVDMKKQAPRDTSLSRNRNISSKNSDMSTDITRS